MKWTKDVVELVPICSVDGSTFAGYGVRLFADGVVSVLGFASSTSRSFAARRGRALAARHAPGVKVVIVKGEPRASM